MTRPSITLDFDTVRENARRWKAHARTPLRAVVKSDGYGWGAEHMVRALDDICDGFCVSDDAEFFAIRACTEQPVALFAQPALSALPAILDANGIPNITSLDALRVAANHAREQGRRVRIRAGIAPALGWAGIDPEFADAFAREAAAAPLDLELWTHFTSPQAEHDEQASFDVFAERCRAHGVAIAGYDVDASASLARRVSEAQGDHVRIGIGLFGTPAIDGGACALRVTATVVSRAHGKPGIVAGYARRPVPQDRLIETLRLGYGDGFPRAFAGADVHFADGDVACLSIGMQYMVIATDASAADASAADTRTLLDAASDLETFCGKTVSTHELVVGLGLANRQAARAQRPRR